MTTIVTKEKSLFPVNEEAAGVVAAGYGAGKSAVESAGEQGDAVGGTAGGAGVTDTDYHEFGVLAPLLRKDAPEQFMDRDDDDEYAAMARLLREDSPEQFM